MQKLTITCIYGKDDTRKLKYRVTDDMPVGVLLEKLISFQFVIDCADPKTFRVLHNGKEISELTQTFAQLSVIDGDELYIMPTVYDPLPPLPEPDIQPKKKPQRKPEHRQSQQKRPSQSGQNHNSSNNNNNNRNKNKSHSSGRHQKSEDTAPKQNNQSSDNKAPVPFKHKSRNFHRTHNRPSGGSTPKSNS